VNRNLSGRAARDRGQDAEARGGSLIKGTVLAMNDRLDGADFAMPGKRGKRGAEHGLAGQHSVLLGQITAGACPAPGCNNHCGDGRSHHVSSRFITKEPIWPSI
jgi:hypothetical protein